MEQGSPLDGVEIDSITIYADCVVAAVGMDDGDVNYFYIGLEDQEVSGDKEACSSILITLGDMSSVIGCPVSVRETIEVEAESEIKGIYSRQTQICITSKRGYFTIVFLTESINKEMPEIIVR